MFVFLYYSSFDNLIVYSLHPPHVAMVMVFGRWCERKQSKSVRSFPWCFVAGILRLSVLNIVFVAGILQGTSKLCSRSINVGMEA